MRVLKNILIGLGALFLVVIVLISWIGMSSSQFRKEEAPFVEKFVMDLSKRWDIGDVRDRMTESFIEQAGTPQAQELLNQFKRLGALKSVHDLELRSYQTINSKKTAVFSFKATFESGDGLVTVTVVANDGVVRVLGFVLRGIHTGPSKLQT